MNTDRTSLAITFSVWKALFLREAVTRISNRRFAWMWLLLEPVFHIAYIMVLFSVIRQRTVGGIDTPLWIMVGLLTFFMFKRSGQAAMNAVNSNQSLFVYRQVKPVDTVLARAALEGFLMVLISVICFMGAGLLNLSPLLVPADPLAVAEAWLAMWLFGLGYGLMTSVAVELIPEVGNIIGMLMAPVYILSGVIFPIGRLPSPYRDWLLLNPLAHGVEAARLAFAPHYQAFPELSIAYIYGCALVIVFLGLALHSRFEIRLVTR
jgi:capsular polysaccharide transport system permease protein